MLIAGSIYLIKSHLNSVTHSKSFIDETPFSVTKNTRFIYNKNFEKLYGDFIFGKNNEYVAVLYVGYGTNPEFLKCLKQYYINAEYSIVIICANGFEISGGNKKVDDCILAEELTNWLCVIKDTFGCRAKILLHGFSYTALAVLNCSDYCYAIFADNTHLCPVYNYKEIKNKILKRFYKNKSRTSLPGINVSVFLSSEKSLSKSTYKLYEIADCKKSVYIYEKFDSKEYLKKLRYFITHLKPPEE